MRKNFSNIKGLKIKADTFGTACQKTIYIKGNIEITKSEAQQVIVALAEALGWLNLQTE